jgi:hypothetical protein
LLARAQMVSPMAPQAVLCNFNNPFSALITSDGLWLLVADTYNHQIRRVALSNGATTTFVGGGGSNLVGNVNGIGTNALMGISNTGVGFVLDAANNGYLADQDYNLIRRIDYATLAVTTVAGTGSLGYADGYGTLAAFTNPAALALVANLLYVAELGDSPSYAGRIRTIQLCPASSSASPSLSPSQTPPASLPPTVTPGLNFFATVSLVVIGIPSCAAATAGCGAMGTAFTVWANLPPSWPLSVLAQCGPSLPQTRRRLQATPSVTASPAVGGSVVFTYTISVPLNGMEI